MKLKKKVYVGLSVDIIHEGHINILRTASRYGEVIVGLLTDEAAISLREAESLRWEIIQVDEFNSDLSKVMNPRPPSDKK